ncbi:MAG: zinc-ribbon domain-containing protein [Lachnospiraceae bacterium]|nr:zinc-ribbon domain-containing protein [Lachnospiraceae bacterium]
MFCSICGSKMDDGTKFCMNCGSPLDQPKMQPNPAPQVQQQAPAQPQPQAQQQAPVQPQLQPQQQAPAQPQSQAQQQAPVQPQPQAQQQAPVQPQPQPQQQAQQNIYMGAPMNQAPQEPPKKKKKGGLVAIIIILALALLGGGGYFAADHFGLIGGSDDPGQVADTDPDEEDPDDEDDPEPEPVIEETQAKQTIMLYIIGSNLESEAGLATDDLEEISRAKLTDDTNIIIQTGGCTNWDNSFCKDNEVQRFCYKDGKFTEIEDLGVISMANIDALTDFISFAADEYPADDYVLILWDHGGGIPIGYGVDENFPDDMIYDYQLGHGIAKTGVHFDSIVFDACNMCTLEVGMSLKDVTDYMIGAESYVNGNGLAYTNWLDLLADSPVSTGDYREMIVSDYMDFCKSKDMVASMSVISLSHIDAVYDAYISYVSELSSDLESRKYSDIITARENCGVYMGTDSVDLVTLANKYESYASTQLINSVVNAVDYTESDFAFGHGITAYFPHDYMEYYGDGRKTFQALKYDSTIIDYFDAYVSLSLAYYYGVSDAEDYAGNWFNSDIIHTYSNGGFTVAEAGEYHLDATLATYADGLDHYYMSTSEIDWLTVMVQLYLEDADGNLYVLGQDQFYNFDDDGDLVADKPSNWTYLTDRVASYIVYDSYEDEDTGKWNQYGVIPAKVNGVESYLMVFYDQDNPTGMVTGYTIIDDEGDYYYELEDDDEIQIIWYCLDTEEYVEAYDPFYASELALDYNAINLDNDKIHVVYEVTDVYGNVYTSDSFVYENGELVDVEEW